MKRKFFYFFKSYFGFTQRETRGFLLIMPVLGLLYAAPILLDMWWLPENETAYEAYLAEANGWLRDQEQEKAANKTKGDFPKNTMKIQDRQDSVFSKNAQLVKKELPKLNTVYFHETDSVLLQMIPGIGPVLSARIVDFREKTGGFHMEEQLLDVYGLNPELAERVYEYFPFDRPVLRKIKINEADFRSLVSHPYVKTGEARVIVAYRNQHGPYKEANDLLNIKIFNQAWIDRISPYLEF